MVPTGSDHWLAGLQNEQKVFQRRYDPSSSHLSASGSQSSIDGVEDSSVDTVPEKFFSRLPDGSYEVLKSGRTQVRFLWVSRTVSRRSKHRSRLCLQKYRLRPRKHKHSSTSSTGKTPPPPSRAERRASLNTLLNSLLISDGFYAIAISRDCYAEARFVDILSRLQWRYRRRRAAY
jgi:hypothetical protein